MGAGVGMWRLTSSYEMTKIFWCESDHSGVWLKGLFVAGQTGWPKCRVLRELVSEGGRVAPTLLLGIYEGG